MDKSNIIRSSEFFMAVGDVLHYTLIVDSGVTPTISLVSVGDNANSEEVPDAVVAIAASDITSSSFTANWNFMENTSEYYLDVATDSAFTSMVAGYDNLSVGNVKEYSVVGLGDTQDYYYRVRGANWVGTGESSNTITTTTANEAVVDADGNVYTYVTIGTQQWMVENFRSTKYADGTPIPNLSESEYTDWFLPSRDELLAMYDELKAHGVGGFTVDGSYYWTSSESAAPFAVAVRFSDRTIDAVNVKGGSNRVRACRSFSALAGTYSLRDTGPGGGLIFHIDGGTTYYEAAPSDTSASKLWSNIDALAIGTTSTAIGEGQNNTNEIIAQVGHTDSAAKLCDDLSAGGWVNDTTGAYCAYDNDVLNIPDYGLLYNWYAVDNAHGLVPAGWRVPTNTDFVNLGNYMGGDAVAGGKLKEIGLSHWSSPNTGATDDYGFKCFGGGERSGSSGAFSFIKIVGYLWSSTAFDATKARMRYILNTGIGLIGNGTSQIKKQGMSIRMMRDVI